MAARFSRLTVPVLLVLIVWFSPGAVSAQTARPPHWGQTVTAEEMRRAGIFRLGEVLRLADRWDVLSMDEYTWRGAPAPMTPFEDDAWTVLVDGLPLDPGLLGVAALERLPLHLDAIDSLEFVEAPRLASGVLADRGLLHIRTRRPAPGLSVEARYTTGSETGDPGPFEFVPPAPENRDRYGHDAGLAAAYGGGAWYVAGGLGLGEHITTDPAIAGRLAPSGSRTRIERTAPSLRLGLNAAGGIHTLLLGQSRLDDNFRLEAFGTELPARSTLDYAGLTGSAPLRSSELRYRLTAEGAEVQSSVGTVEPRLDFGRTTLKAEVELALGGTGGHDLVGFGVAHRNVRTHYVLRDDPALVFRTFGSLGWRLTESIGQRLSLELEAGAGDFGAGVILEQEWRASAREAVSLVLAGNRRLREDDEGLYALTARGYDWLRDAGVPVVFEGPDDAPRAATVTAAWERVLAGGLALRLTGFYQAFTADYLARRELSFDSQQFAWRGPLRLESGRRGEVGGLQLGGEGALSRVLAVRASYRVRWVISGGAAIEDAWDRVPHHSSRVHLAYTPVPGLALWGGLAYRGETRWAEYPGAVGSTPRALSLDLSVGKEFWDRRLRASLALRNLFDSSVQFHPEGATAGRAAFITVETVLPARRRAVRSRSRSSAAARDGEATGRRSRPPRSVRCCGYPGAGSRRSGRGRPASPARSFPTASTPRETRPGCESPSPAPGRV